MGPHALPTTHINLRSSVFICHIVWVFQMRFCLKERICYFVKNSYFFSLLVLFPLALNSARGQCVWGGNNNQTLIPTDVLTGSRLADNVSAFTQQRWRGEQAGWQLCFSLMWLCLHPSLIIILLICIVLDHFQRTFTDFILFDPLKSL